MARAPASMWFSSPAYIQLSLCLSLADLHIGDCKDHCPAGSAAPVPRGVRKWRCGGVCTCGCVHTGVHGCVCAHGCVHVGVWGGVCTDVCVCGCACRYAWVCVHGCVCARVISGPCSSAGVGCPRSGAGSCRQTWAPRQEHTPASPASTAHGNHGREPWEAQPELPASSADFLEQL